jgi:hypothetical protein
MQGMELSSWSSFEALIASKKLLMQYVETPTAFEIYAPEADTFLWHITLLKGTSDGDDFENNHKATANAPLEIKAGPGRPQRVCISPQPDGTYWHEKGYVLECGANDSTAELIVSFSAKVYLNGGEIVSPSVVEGDKFKGEVQTQIGGNWTTILAPLEDIYMLPNLKSVVRSDECMEMPTTYRLKITFTPAATGTAKKLYVKLDYFQ